MKLPVLDIQQGLNNLLGLHIFIQKAFGPYFFRFISVLFLSLESIPSLTVLHQGPSQG